MKFEYIETDSRIFGKIYKPLVYIEIFSEKHDIWCGIDKVLVDTGADISIIPKNMGELIVNTIESGRKAIIKGVTAGELSIHIHKLRIKVAGKEFESPVAIADTDDVPSVLGRFEALDIFNAEFTKGKELSIEG